LKYIPNQKKKNPVEIAQNAIKHAKANFNVVIVDTAGRLARSRNDGRDCS
jgi:signal recognition particle GTPase